MYTIGDYISLGFFILDICVNLRTTYYTSNILLIILENNDEIIDPKKILKNYIGSTTFIIDLVSTVPISEITDLVVADSGSSSDYV